MGQWCPTKSNYMGGWYFAAWNRKKEYYLPKKKREVLSNLAKRKRRAKQTAAETAIIVYTQSSKLRCFRRILVKNATKINFPTVASREVITSLEKHVFSEEFIQRNNAIGRGFINFFCIQVSGKSRRVI